MKALLIDDEKHCRENLAYLIQKYCPEIDTIKMADSVKGGLEVIKSYTPDILFLDIQMPEGDGFNLLKQTDTSKISVVFVTAHDEFALRAIKCGPTAFLLKPVDIDDLKDAVALSLKTASFRNDNKSIFKEAIEELTMSLEVKKNPTKICLAHTSKLEIIDLSDIIQIFSDSYYSTFEISDGSKITMAKTLKYYEEIVGELFIRVHQSHLVNINHIKEFSFEDSKVKMSNQKKIPVSRRKVSELTKVLKKIN